MTRPEFNQYDHVFFNGVRAQIVGVNPISKTFNVRSANSLAQNIEAKELFATYEEWQGANPEDPLNKPVDLLAWHKPPVAPRPEKLKPQATPKTPDKFDYSQLAQDDQIAIRVQVSNIKTVMKRTAEGILTIGESLADVQKRLANHHRGTFQEWLKAEFGWSKSTAYNYINVYEQFGSRPNFGQLDIAASALYMLAESSTPEDVVDEIIDRAEAGEQIKRGDVIEVKQKDAAQPEVGERVSPLNADAGEQPAREETVAADDQLASIVDPPEISPQNLNVIETSREETAEPIPSQSTGRQKPKSNVKGDHEEGEPDPRDACQTPDYAVDPLLPFLKQEWTIWEPAYGEGLLVDALFDGGLEGIITSDLLNGQDFFKYQPDYDVIVTNPPYSTKYDWLARCYALGKPFALLMPIDTLGSKAAQALFKKHGVEIIFMSDRVDFKMPEKAWRGGGAQFSSAWFTWQMNLGQENTFADIEAAKVAFKQELREAGEID